MKLFIEVVDAADQGSAFLFIAHKLYPIALGISMEKSEYTWMSILISDKAAFYCNLALMQACNEFFLGHGEKSLAAIYHLSNSLKYDRERLESEEALSDSTMGIVMSLITQEQCRQQHKAARIHMDGLAQMIKTERWVGITGRLLVSSTEGVQVCCTSAPLVFIFY
ncbi:hypothetical protein PMIN03_001543 [Paraphaeosphaeria minitans]